MKSIALKLALTIIAAIVFIAPNNAMATKKLYSPYVEKGEIEFEYRGGYKINDKSGKSDNWTQKFAIGYGISDVWFTEFYAEFKDKTNSDLYALEMENKFMLTEPGQYWADFGILTELEINTNGGNHKAGIGLLVAKDVNKFTHKANIIFDREFSNNAPNEIGFNLALGTKYRYNKAFEPGFEVYSDFGSLTNGKSFSEQKHIAGPVIYGKIGHFKYDAGVLFGMSNAADDITLKTLFEYEWRF